MNDDIDAFLEHHGVKGQRWGVRKKEDLVGDKTSLSPLEKKVLKTANDQGLTEDRMKKMYGPSEKGSTKKDSSKFRFTEGEKSALKTALVVGGSAAALYGLHKLGQNAVLRAQLGEFADSGRLKDFWKDYQHSASKLVMSEKEIAGLSTKRVHLPIGSIIKRISTEAETTINPGGFYAAHKPEDVNRYKAVLPVFWKLWGIDKGNGGHVVNLRAEKEILAPSPKETFHLFEEFLETPLKVGGFNQGKHRDLFDPNEVRKDLGLAPKKVVPTHDIARNVFREAAAKWVDPNDTTTKGFFEFLKSKGFNAVVDHNDLGHLSDSPLRVLNGSDFSIAGTERLTVDKIREAQNELVDVLHSLVTKFVEDALERNALVETEVDIETFLEHHGIKGMRWGYRRQRLQEHLDRVNRIAAGTASPEDRAAVSARRKRNLKVAGATTMAVGAAFVALAIRQHGKSAIRNQSLNAFKSAGKQWIDNPVNHQLQVLTIINKAANTLSGV